MWVVYGIVWILAGLALAVIGWAVIPAERAPSAASVVPVGALGGLLGGLLIELWAAGTVPGSFTAGFIGSLMGSCIALIVRGLVAGPARRAA